ncbi:Glutathione S-transferase U17-like protein [Drosera capensis]
MASLIYLTLSKPAIFYTAGVIGRFMYNSKKPHLEAVRRTLRTKHVEVHYHFVRETILQGKIEIKYVNTNEQVADIFTKGFNRAKFDDLWKQLDMIIRSTVKGRIVWGWGVEQINSILLLSDQNQFGYSFEIAQCKMAKGDVKLLGTWVSPFALRVKVALKLKSVDYEYLEENLRGGKSELLLKSNPVHKKIPVLLHGDRPVSESLIIVQYIDEVWTDGPSILPSDPYDRAIARFWAAYVDDKVHPFMRAIMTANDEEAREAVAKFKEVLVLLEDAFVKSSKGKPFFGGHEIGYVDIAFGAFVGWLKVIEKALNAELFDEATTPNLLVWVVAFLAHPAVKDITPSTDKLLEFAKNVVLPTMKAVAPASQ